MNKIVLIAGADTQLGLELCRHFESLEYQVVKIISSINEAVEEADEKNIFKLSSSSIVAIRSVIIKATTYWNSINQFIIIQDSNLGDSNLLNDEPLLSIDQKVDQHFKKYIFLSREILYYLKNVQNADFGLLALVGTIPLPTTSKRDISVAPPLRAALAGAFSSLASALSGEIFEKTGIVHYFETVPGWLEAKESANNEYAEFIVETIMQYPRQKTGRRFRYPSRSFTRMRRKKI